MNQKIENTQTDTLENQFLAKIQSGSLADIKEFLKKFEPLKTNNIVQFLFNETFFSNGFLAIHIAAQNGHANLVKFLIENGAIVDAQTKEQKTTALQLSIQAKKLEAAAQIIPYSDVNTLSIEEYRNLLWQLIAAKQHNGVLTLLAKTSPDLKTKIVANWIEEDDFINLAKIIITDSLPTKKKELSPLQKFLKSNQSNQVIDLIPYSNVNLLNKKEFRGLLLHLINTKQLDAIQILLSKTNEKFKKEILNEWIIEENKEDKHCLIFALDKDREIFNILAEHGANPFYNPWTSTANPAFMVVVRKEDMDASFKILMSQTNISQFDTGFDFIPIFLSQCIAKKDVSKIETIIPQLAKVANNEFALTHAMSWPFIIDSYVTTLAEQSLKNEVPEFLHAILDSEHLASYTNRYIDISIIHTMYNKGYFGLICKVFEKHEKKDTLIEQFYWENNRQITALLRGIIKSKNIHKSRLFCLLKEKHYWKESIAKNISDLAYHAATHSHEILKTLLDIDSTIATLDYKNGKSLIEFTVQFQNKESYDSLQPYYEKEGKIIPEFDNPLYSTKTPLPKASLVQEGPGERAESSIDFNQITDLLDRNSNKNKTRQALPSHKPSTQIASPEQDKQRNTIPKDSPIRHQEKNSFTPTNAIEYFDSAL